MRDLNLIVLSDLIPQGAHAGDRAYSDAMIKDALDFRNSLLM